MKHRPDRHVKLGIFVLAGTAFLLLLLFMIGRNKQMFGHTYRLKVHVKNAQGLVPGNNVRYAGIQAGTVKSVSILNDTSIEVVMSIATRMKQVIRKNALVSIGTEGVVGNKVVNIVPGKGSAALADNDDLLLADMPIDTDKMLRTLQGTNEDIAAIASSLKETISRVNESKALWSLLEDESLPLELKQAAGNIRAATAKASQMTGDLRDIIANVKEGKGSLGSLLKDSTAAQRIEDAFTQVTSTAKSIDSLSAELHAITGDIKNDLRNGKGPLQAALRDTALVNKLAQSLDNIQKGTDGFNQSMEALKHNFLLRGYFRKQERKQKKAEQATGNKIVLQR